MLLVAPDTIGLERRHLEAAVAQLERFDAVFGPARDGGFYLLGLRRPLGDVLAGIVLSTDTARADAEAALSAAGFSVATLDDDLDDCDDEAGLQALLALDPPGTAASLLATMSANRPRHAVITGGSSGIGLALARRLAGRGTIVTLIGRDAERLAGAARQVGPLARTLICDVADRDAVRDAAARIGSVDLVVANAGISGRADVLASGDELDREVMATNHHGTVDLVTSLWPALKRSGAGQVVIVSSVAGTVPLPAVAPYMAAKHAQLAWARALVPRAREDGVRVLIVNPGPVETPGFPQAQLLGHPIARRLVIKPEACAAAIMRGLDANAREIYVPPAWRVVALAGGIAPNGLARLVTRFWS